MFRRLIIPIILFTSAGWAQTSATTQPVSRIEVILAPDTTIFTGPLTADGQIDYAAILNARNSKDIPADQNAAALLQRIVDPTLTDAIGLERRKKIRTLLQLETSPTDEIAWNTWPGFQHPLPTDDPSNPHYVDRYGDAGCHPWSSTEDPELAAWINSNAQALDVVAQASRLPHYWLPIVRCSDDPPGLTSRHVFDDIHLLRDISTALYIRSMMKLHDGDPAGGLQDLLIIRRLGALILHSPDGDPDLQTIGMAMCPVWTEWRILQEANAPPDKLRQWAADVIACGQFPLPRESWRICRYDYLATIQAMAAQTKGLQPPNMNLPFLDWNRALRMGNKFYDEFEKDMSTLTPAQGEAADAALIDRVTKMDATGDDKSVPLPGEILSAFTDRIATTFLLLKLPNFRGYANMARRNNRLTDWLTHAGVALEIYHQDNGHYPAKLDDLISKYLPRLPDYDTTYPLAYELHDVGYIIRRVIKYDPDLAARMAQSGQDYDPADILIRTDQHP